MILLNTSTFSYWTKTCHVSKNIKKYLNDVVVRGRQNLFLFRLRRNFFLLEKTVNEMIIILLKKSTDFSIERERVTCQRT